MIRFLFGGILAGSTKADLASLFFFFFLAGKFIDRVYIVKNTSFSFQVARILAVLLDR
jgi:hypothetical protein